MHFGIPAYIHWHLFAPVGQGAYLQAPRALASVERSSKGSSLGLHPRLQHMPPPPLDRALGAYAHRFQA